MTLTLVPVIQATPRSSNSIRVETTAVMTIPFLKTSLSIAVVCFLRPGQLSLGHRNGMQPETAQHLHTVERQQRRVPCLLSLPHPVVPLLPPACFPAVSSRAQAVGRGVCDRVCPSPWPAESLRSCRGS